MKKFYTLFCALPLASVMIGQDANVLKPATFDDLDLPTESWWIGDVDDPDYFKGTFRSGSFEFNNYYNSEWGSWGFFGYANETGNVFPGGYAIKDQMLNCVGGGYESAAYGMGFIANYMGNTEITIPDFEETGVNVNGVWLTNSAWVVKAILEGDGISGPFDYGDWLKLIFKGYDKDGNENQVEFYLADYTSDSPEEHYYVDSWRYCDLSNLGNVVKIDMDMISTKANDYGMTTPGYFAFDDLGVTDGGSRVETPEVSPEIRIAVAEGFASVACAVKGFKVEAISMGGITAEAISEGDYARVKLPAAGVNLIRIVTSEAVQVIKVFNR